MGGQEIVAHHAFFQEFDMEVMPNDRYGARTAMRKKAMNDPKLKVRPEDTARLQKLFNQYKTASGKPKDRLREALAMVFCGLYGLQEALGGSVMVTDEGAVQKLQTLAGKIRLEIGCSKELIVSSHSGQVVETVV